MYFLSRSPKSHTTPSGDRNSMRLHLASWKLLQFFLIVPASCVAGPVRGGGGSSGEERPADLLEAAHHEHVLAHQAAVPADERHVLDDALAHEADPLPHRVDGPQLLHVRDVPAGSEESAKEG
jgi:hypothetical protein